jgi:hypothetical protein
MITLREWVEFQQAASILWLIPREKRPTLEDAVTWLEAMGRRGDARFLKQFFEGSE